MFISAVSEGDWGSESAFLEVKVCGVKWQVVMGALGVSLPYKEHIQSGSRVREPGRLLWSHGDKGFK